MVKWPHSLVTRIVIGYSLLLVGAIALISAMFYFGTAGLMARRTRSVIDDASHHLIVLERDHGRTALVTELHSLLTDHQDVDTEIYALQDAQGRWVIGNISAPTPPLATEQAVSRRIWLHDQWVDAVLAAHRFDDGSVLIVGRDVDDQHALRRMIVSALGLGAVLALVLAAAGMMVVYRQLRRQALAIRQTTHQIIAGQWGKRIVVGSGQDEFAEIGRDINTMLDELERLLAASRGVSNAIAHNLRTPLARMQTRLEQVLLQSERSAWVETAHEVIAEIEAVTRLFEKLLQIAEAQAGVRRSQFSAVPIAPMLESLLDLYAASAEQAGACLEGNTDGQPQVFGDRDLLAGALANLLDNAIHYAAAGARIQLSAEFEQGQVVITVRDDGPGLPGAELSRASQPFYRGSNAASVSGSGLGLAIAAAVASLHGGSLHLRDAKPGLAASLHLPSL